MIIRSLTKRSIFYVLGWLIIPFFLVDNFRDLNLAVFLMFGILFLVVIAMNIRGLLGRVHFAEHDMHIDGDYRLDKEEQLQKSYIIQYQAIKAISFETHDPIYNTSHQPLVRGLRSDHLHRIKYGREPYQVMVFHLISGHKAKLILNAFSKKQQATIEKHLREKEVLIPQRSDDPKRQSPYTFRRLWDIFTFIFLFIFFIQIIHARIYGGNATPIPEGLIIANPEGYYLITQGMATEVTYQVWLTNYILIWITFLLLITVTLLGILHLIQKYIMKKKQ